MKTQHTPGPTHTPIPWGMEITADTTWIGQLRSDGKKLFTITAQCDGGHSDGYVQAAHDTKLANAEFIVRAVNNHEALIEACKESAELLARIPAFGDTIGTEINKAQCGIALRNLRAAIAKATQP